MRGIATRFISAGAACLLAACGSSLTPEDVPGKYHLTSIGGDDTPPYDFEWVFLGTTTVLPIMSATLTLESDDTFHAVYDVEGPNSLRETRCDESW